MKKPQYVLQWESHSKNLSSMLCSLMESQFLVDVTIICKSHSVQVHKCVLAANSLYFKERFEKQPSTTSIEINDMEFPPVKALIEFMYCGKTTVNEDDIQQFIQGAMFFQIRGLKNMSADKMGVPESKRNAAPIQDPVFINALKPDSSTMANPSEHSSEVHHNVNLIIEDANYTMFKKPKTKGQNTIYVPIEADMALAKEEAASRMALEMLSNQFHSSSEAPSFVVEESCVPNARQYHQNIPAVDGTSQIILEDISSLNGKNLNQIALAGSDKEGAAFNLADTAGNYVFETVAEDVSFPQGKIIDIEKSMPIVYDSNSGCVLSVAELPIGEGNPIQYEIIDHSHLFSKEMFPQSVAGDGSLGNLSECVSNALRTCRDYEYPQVYDASFDPSMSGLQTKTYSFNEDFVRSVEKLRSQPGSETVLQVMIEMLKENPNLFVSITGDSLSTDDKLELLQQQIGKLYLSDEAKIQEMKEKFSGLEKTVDQVLKDYFVAYDALQASYDSQKIEPEVLKENQTADEVALEEPSNSDANMEDQPETAILPHEMDYLPSPSPPAVKEDDCDTSNKENVSPFVDVSPEPIPIESRTDETGDKTPEWNVSKSADVSARKTRSSTNSNVVIKKVKVDLSPSSDSDDRKSKSDDEYVPYFQNSSSGKKRRVMPTRKNKYKYSI